MQNLDKKNLTEKITAIQKSQKAISISNSVRIANRVLKIWNSPDSVNKAVFVFSEQQKTNIVSYYHLNSSELTPQRLFNCINKILSAENESIRWELAKKEIIENSFYDDKGSIFDLDVKNNMNKIKFSYNILNDDFMCSIPANPTMENCSNKLDLIILIDTSLNLEYDFQNLKLKLIKIIDSLDLEQNKTRIWVLTTNDSMIMIHDGDNYDKFKVKAAILDLKISNTDFKITNGLRKAKQILEKTNNPKSAVFVFTNKFVISELITKILMNFISLNSCLKLFNIKNTNVDMIYKAIQMVKCGNSHLAGYFEVDLKYIFDDFVLLELNFELKNNHIEINTRFIKDFNESTDAPILYKYEISSNLRIKVKGIFSKIKKNSSFLIWLKICLNRQR